MATDNIFPFFSLARLDLSLLLYFMGTHEPIYNYVSPAPLLGLWLHLATTGQRQKI